MKKIYFPYEIDSDSPIPYLFRNISNRIDAFQITAFTNSKKSVIRNPNVQERYLPPEGNTWRRRFHFGLTSIQHHDLIHTGGRGQRHYRISKITHTRNQNLKHIHTLRVDIDPDSALGPLTYKKKLIEMANTVTAVSQHTAKTAEKHLGISPQVIYNGVDSEKFRPNYECPRLFKELNISQPVVLYVGSFQPRKNPMDIIYAAERLPDVTFLLVGDGERYKEVEKYSADLENVILTGRLPKRTLPPIYANSTVFAFPSIREGCPNVVLEAMASELPVVGYQATSIPELVEDGVSGYLVEPNDIDAFAEAISTSMDSSKELGSAAREYVLKNHSFDRIADQYKSVYADLL